MKRVPRFDRPDAGRGPGIDQVTGLQLEEARQLADDLRDRPDELSQIACLPPLAVDIEPDGALRRMADLGSRRNRRTGCRLLEGFADLPGATQFLGPALQIAPRSIEP